MKNTFTKFSAGPPGFSPNLKPMPGQQPNQKPKAKFQEVDEDGGMSENAFLYKIADFADEIH